jgi:hypothetical protein
MDQMANKDWEKWVRGLYEEIDSIWQKHRSCEAIDKGKYVIFYSVPRMNPNFMIIGENPGGSSEKGPYATAIESGSLDKMISGELIHDYIAIKETSEDYEVAKLMRGIFERLGLEADLAPSVKLNLNFFRSGTRAKFNAIADEGIRSQLQEQSRMRVWEIIRKLKPKIIITEGWRAFDEIANRAGMPKNVHTEYRVGEKDGKRRLIKMQSHEDFILVGIVHSASRPRFRTSSDASSEFRKVITFLKERLLPLLY